VAYVETLGANGEGSLLDLVGRSSPRPVRSGGGREFAGGIVYTSGTTGRSKGAVLTRGNLASNAEVLADAWHFSERDVLLHTLPLNHVHGLFAAINTVLASGSSLLLMPKFDAVAVLERLPEATVYMGVPTHYVRLLQEPALDRAAAASMRLFVSGSAPLLAGTPREFRERTGHAIVERYGMTETLMIASNPYGGVRVPGSVGPALAGVSVRLAAGTDADAGDVGGIEVRGPKRILGLLARSGQDAGGIHPGRLVQDRRSRQNRRPWVCAHRRACQRPRHQRRYNVYPKEVELELDAIMGVGESAVFGVAHPDFGEGVTAAVVLEPGAKPLRIRYHRCAEAEAGRDTRSRRESYSSANYRAMPWGRSKRMHSAPAIQPCTVPLD